MDISIIVGLFNIVVGVLLVASILAMVAGFALWGMRLGTSNTDRDDAIEYMQWGVSILFTVVVFLGVAQFVQQNKELAVMIALGAGLLLAAYFTINVVMAGEGDGHAEQH